MKGRQQTSDVVEILHRRYVGDDPKRQAAIEEARVHAQVARTIYDLRTEAGLTQQELAELVGTKQSVISRLENEDYDGHSLSMLNRIARALNRRMTVEMTTGDPKADALRCAFQLLLRNLRRARGLTVDVLAQKTGIDREELLAAECQCGYRPTPFIVHALSQFYGLAERRLGALAGAFRNVPETLTQSAASYAMQSESLAKLTKEERAALDQFIQALGEE